MNGPEASLEKRDENPYASPQAARGVPLSSSARENAPADRGARLGAYLINQVVVVIAFIPGFLLAVMLEIPFMGDEFELSLVLYSGVVVLAVVQMILLVRDGQTIGKKAVSIKVVRYEDGRKAGFARVWLIREFVNALFIAIPLVGVFYFIVDLLCILGEERRCIHDYLARTKVVRAVPRRYRFRQRQKPATHAERADPEVAGR